MGLLDRILGRHEPKQPPDNSGRKCHALDRKVEYGGLVLVGTCSLCGAEIELFPATDRRCQRCLAKVEHLV